MATIAHRSIRSEPSISGLVVAGKFKIGRRIGGGTFGELYAGVNITNGVSVAIKVEKTSATYPQLAREARLYTLLAPHDLRHRVRSVPEYYYFGTEGEYSVLVIELLGYSLDILFKGCKCRFSMKTTLQLADQMIQRLEFMHSRGLVHRDMKPDNFMLGSGKKQHHVYLIDFGLSKRFRDGSQHVPFKDGKSLVGTARYCSVNTHLGIDQSRRDDMEALGYILIYFVRGTLPWQGLTATPSTRVAKIASVKMNTSVQDLCKGLPSEFAAYVHYTRSLDYTTCPDYAYLRSLFRTLYNRYGYEDDGSFDWTGMSDREIRKPDERL